MTSERHPISRQVCLGLSPWLFSIAVRADAVGWWGGIGIDRNSTDPDPPRTSQSSHLGFGYCTTTRDAGFCPPLPRGKPPPSFFPFIRQHPVRLLGPSKNSNSLSHSAPSSVTCSLVLHCVCALRLVTCEHVPGFSALRLPLR